MTDALTSLYSETGSKHLASLIDEVRRISEQPLSRISEKEASERHPVLFRCNVAQISGSVLRSVSDIKNSYTPILRPRIDTVLRHAWPIE